jgi:putative flavoprotein involved in K+ transport
MFTLFGKTEHVETVIVGGGQAGLAISYYLKQSGHAHVVLEQAAQAGHSWRNNRWDSFTLVTPNWTLTMPGAEYNGPDREGFMPRAEVVAYFEQYVERFHLSVQYKTCVVSVERLEPLGYRVQTTAGNISAKNVVIANGQEQRPKIPAYTKNLSPQIDQLHSRAYRNPQSLPEGAVLVVGSGQSGCQIAEELYKSGRRVFLATGSTGRAPRRYRGKDTVEWLYLSGFFDTPPEKLPFPKDHFSPPQISGANGGHTLNLHRFARDGVRLLGHLRDVADEKVFLSPDLHQNLAKSDQGELFIQKRIDGYIQANGIDAPTEELPQLQDGYKQPITEELDLKAEGVTSIIWATGYAPDFSIVKLPVQDERGFPIQTGGVSRYPGLYFAGMPWMPAIKSGMLLGVGESAQRISSMLIEKFERVQEPSPRFRVIR